jgi:hypothetical protein
MSTVLPGLRGAGATERLRVFVFLEAANKCQERPWDDAWATRGLGEGSIQAFA